MWVLRSGYTLIQIVEEKSYSSTVNYILNISFHSSGSVRLLYSLWVKVSVQDSGKSIERLNLLGTAWRHRKNLSNYIQSAQIIRIMHFQRASNEQIRILIKSQLSRDGPPPQRAIVEGKAGLQLSNR